jgi:FtsH-binding integral membrane protein
MRRPISTSAASNPSDLIHAGLRSYLQRVYMYMGMGLGFTALVAFFIASTPSIHVPLFQSGLMWLFIFAPLGIALFFTSSIRGMRAQTAQILFWTYTALMGVSLSSIALIYTGESIARIFLITSCTFCGMSLYGYTTQKDLSSFSSFLFMGLLGVILASLVNLFMQSSALQFALSVMTVLIFTGLTAYDTQKIRDMYDASLPEETQTKMALMGALQLYLDFLNIFLALLRLFGDRR